MFNVADDWWRDFFNDQLIVEMWLGAVPEAYTRAEVEFLKKMLQVEPPAKLLDVPCGGGRHALAFAGLGYQMTGVDGSAAFLSAARTAGANLPPITWLQRNMRDIDFHEAFDGAYCFGNSFGYLDDAGNAAFLKAVFESLKPGARFVLDHSMVLESRLSKFQERNWELVGDIYFIEDERYDPAQGRVLTEYTLIRGGEAVKRQASHRCYTYRQVCEMLTEAGFVDVRSYGSISQEPFSYKSNSLYAVARKPI